jgi:hypothetical protein
MRHELRAARRIRPEDPRDQLDGDHRAEDRDRPLLEARQPTRPSAEIGEPLRLDRRQSSGEAARRAEDGHRQNDQPEDDGDCLDEIRQGVGHQAAEYRVGNDDDGRDGNADDQRQIRDRAHHLAKGADLCRAPDDRAGQDQEDRQPLHSRRVALAEQAGERDARTAPQRNCDRHADDYQCRGISGRGRSSRPTRPSL